MNAYGTVHPINVHATYIAPAQKDGHYLKATAFAAMHGARHFCPAYSSRQLDGAVGTK